MGTILLVILVLLLLGAIPAWPHSSNWGYGPSGVLCVVGYARKKKTPWKSAERLVCQFPL